MVPATLDLLNEDRAPAPFRARHALARPDDFVRHRPAVKKPVGGGDALAIHSAFHATWIERK